MIDKSIIKPIPRWWVVIPFLGTHLATTVYPSIYFPKQLWEEITSGDISIETESIYVHEYVHIERQKKYGPLLWNFAYLCSRGFRLQEELAAIEKQMIFLIQHGHTYDISRKARQFSNWNYLWVLPFENARLTLESLWHKCLIENS